MRITVKKDTDSNVSSNAYSGASYLTPLCLSFLTVIIIKTLGVLVNIKYDYIYKQWLAGSKCCVSIFIVIAIIITIIIAVILTKKM